MLAGHGSGVATVEALGADGRVVGTEDVPLIKTLRGSGRRPARLFTREAAGGVSIHADLVGGACVAQECSPASLVVGLSTEGAVARLGGFPRDEGSTLRVVRTEVFGKEEGSPGSIAVVRVAPEVATVQVQFSDGTVDAMAPVHGWAVLAVSGASSFASVVALDANGRTLAACPSTFEDLCG